MKPGNLVGRGESTLLTTISQIDPILFRIGVSEAEYLRYARRATARTGGDPRGGGFQLTLSDGSVYPHTGKVNTVDRAVDPATGTLGIQLEFANPNLLLRPGQYGKVRLLLENKAQALLIPQRAVQELQSIRSVAVVDDSGMVSFRTVKVGQKVDSLWVIEEGLKLGDRVVVEGLQRVQDGTTVVAKAAPASGDPGATPTSGSSPAEGK
jgi:membrane fusion protein (multidrug efflux system)